MKQIFYLILSISFFSCSISKEYYENGNLETKGIKSNQIKIGDWKYYYPSGKYQGGGKYRNGKRNGQWKWFHENGELWQIGHFLNDEQTGEWKFFHDNGNREGIGSSLNGGKIGKWIWYHTNGKLYTERLWENGKLLEIISCLDGNGNQLDKGSIINGTGTMNLYDMDGNLIEALEYKNGELLEE
tara:strand:+ start:4122 stop:4676 length:555 start_codon:yes stop_codon:yes gene_type:complete